MNPATEVRSAPPIVRLEIPALAEWVAVARLAVAAVGTVCAVDAIEDVKLAIAESCTMPSSTPGRRRAHLRVSEDH